MFTYLNPDVRQRLIADGKLTRIDSEGQLIDVDQQEPPNELAINLMGPIPLPINCRAWIPPSAGMPQFEVLNCGELKRWLRT